MFSLGLTDGAVNTVPGGFKTIFWSWAKFINLCLVVDGLVASSIVSYYLAKAFGYDWVGWAALGLFALVGIGSQVYMMWMIWDKVIPQMAKDGQYFFYGDEKYTVLRGRENQVVGTYDDNYRLVGNLFWKGNLFQREQPYPAKEDLSGKAKDLKLVYTGQRICLVKAEAETIDGTIVYEFILWYQIEVNKVKDVVTELSGMFFESLTKTVEDTVQDALMAMRTLHARMLTSKSIVLSSEWLLQDLPSVPEGSKTHPVAATDRSAVQKALKQMQKRLEREVHIKVLDWGFGNLHTPDGELEKAFMAQTVAMHAADAAEFEGESKRLRDAPRWAEWRKRFPGDLDGRFIAAQDGAHFTLNESHTTIGLTPEVGQVAKDVAGAMKNKSGKSKPSGSGGTGGGATSS